MPLGSEINLSGRLNKRNHDLVLCVDGGEWKLITPTGAASLIGRDVNVLGQRTGFNEIMCEAVWPTNEPRPKLRAIKWEALIVGALVLGAYAAMLGWLITALI